MPGGHGAWGPRCPGATLPGGHGDSSYINKYSKFPREKQISTQNKVYGLSTQAMNSQHIHLLCNSFRRNIPRDDMRGATNTSQQSFQNEAYEANSEAQRSSVTDAGYETLNDATRLSRN